MTSIRTSKHTLSFTNKQKRTNLSNFIDEYRRVSKIILDDIWENGYEWMKDENVSRFSVQENLLNFPSFIDYKRFYVETFLTARSLSSLTTQLAGMINAEVEKQKKRLFMLNKLKEQGKSKKQRASLIKKIKQNIPQKPNCENINPEISSKCCDWMDVDGKFEAYLRLRSITRDKTEIKLPIKLHRHARRLMSKRERMNSFLVSKNNVYVRWKKDITKRKDGSVIGCDQGMKDILTCSDGQVTPKQDIHGHTLETILKKMSRKRKGSKSFHRAQEHRKNFINWSLNQLNFDNIKEVRLEKIWNIRYKTRVSRIMSHWVNTLIRDKIELLCEDNEVRLVYQDSTYRSQRCSGCGVVRKANRKGKIYKCKHCGLEIDADLNASFNHEIELPEVPYALRKLKLNRGNGFYWLGSGFYDFKTSRSLESLLPVEEKHI